MIVLIASWFDASPVSFTYYSVFDKMECNEPYYISTRNKSRKQDAGTEKRGAG